MSSEVSARNPELLAEAAPAKFVNEGVCLHSALDLVVVFGISPPVCVVMCLLLSSYNRGFRCAMFEFRFEAPPIVLRRSHRVSAADPLYSGYKHGPISHLPGWDCSAKEATFNTAVRCVLGVDELFESHPLGGVGTLVCCS